jgi:2-polyprenyl-6-methoxyphenol hydroxylase-like FAD-dependent oxidoreductase
MVNIKDQETGRPEIDRVQLRKLFLESIPPENIQWVQRLLTVSPVSLDLGTYTETGFDLIVGADGAWSTVRPMCTYATTYYSDITGIEMLLSDADTKHPEISEMVGSGSFFSLGDDEGQTLFFQRNGDNSIRVYAFGKRPEN